MKRKRYYKRVKQKNVQIHFSLRDAWEVIAVVFLLSVIVYTSHYVKNNHLQVAIWPQIKSVKITGKLDTASRPKFESIIQRHIAGGFFRVQMSKLEQDLSALPWVYQATVQRLWPSTLKVKVVEQSPIARWGDSGLMNTYGEIFYPRSTESYMSLPMLYGEDGRAKYLAAIFEISLKQLQPLGLTLRGLFENERQSKHLVLSNGLVLAIGDGDVSEKISRFITAYEQYLSPYLSEVEKLDLRYTNGLAVEWNNPQFANNLEMESNL